MVRIISGLHRGRRLEAPGNKLTRPTTDMVKEWIFNVLGDIKDANVLDLFAGTGSLGLEAISRGAESVTFVESSGAVASLIRRNVETIGCESECDIVRSDSKKFLLRSEEKNWNLIFADPPYNYRHTAEIAELALAKIGEEGTFVLEAPWGIEGNLPVEPSRSKQFGETAIYLF